MTDPALEAPPASAPERLEGVPRRWTLHGLNNGVIFNATCRGVEILPRPVSYAIGRVGTWLAWRVMDRTREAVADNLKALAPDATDRELERLALDTLRSYAKDVIDFLRALQVRGGNAGALFSYRDEDAQRIIQSRAQGRGIILVLGHYGNWEIGSVFMRRVLDLPLTVVAMAEANAEVNRIRHEIRRSLDIDTIEVRKSLDTALQLRRRLAENHVVAMLMDRHVGRDRVDVSLFGRRAGFLRTPAMMGYLTGAPLVPCFIERLGAARYSVETGEPIVVSRECPRDQAIESAAQRFADELAARITRRPHNWYHFYPYWKAQSEGYGELGK